MGLAGRRNGFFWIITSLTIRPCMLVRSDLELWPATFCHHASGTSEALNIRFIVPFWDLSSRLGFLALAHTNRQKSKSVKLLYACPSRNTQLCYPASLMFFA